MTVVDQDRESAIRTRMAEISGGEPTVEERALLVRLITSFTARTPAAIDVLAGVLESGDLAAVQDHAHALKGSANNLGIDRLGRLFAELEAAARAGRATDPAATLADIRNEYAAVEPVCAAIAADLHSR